MAVVPPIWSGTQTYGESVVLLSTSGGTAQGKLLRAPTGGISGIQEVRTARRDVVLIAGIDWTYNSATQSIEKVAGGIAPSLVAEILAPGGVPVVHENRLLHEAQLAVTYTHSAGGWSGPTTSASAKLTTIRTKLIAGNPVKIVVWGDSISVGANASGFPNGSAYDIISPYMPVWAELVTRRLTAKFGSVVTLANKSVGGQQSSYGSTNHAAQVLPENPDLVIYGWGMNDGAANVAAATYAANMAAQLADLRGTHATADAIMLSSMLPTQLTNPPHTGKHALYGAQLATIAAGDGHCESIDVTAASQALLTAKNYVDQSGNNYNHPSDYMHRVYAQLVLGLLDGL